MHGIMNVKTAYSIALFLVSLLSIYFSSDVADFKS